MNKIYSVIRPVLFAFTGLLFWCGNAQAQYTGTGVFNKVTAAADLTDGYYVFAYGTTYAMNNSYVSSTYLDRTAITVAANAITNPATAIVWKVETNGAGKSIFNEVSAQYVSYTGSSNNVQVAGAVTADNQRWAITYSGGTCTVSNLAVSNRDLQYNTSAPRFACYTGSQVDITLYKLTISNYYWDISTAAGLGGSATWGTTFNTVAAGTGALVTAPATAQTFFQGTPGTLTLAADATVTSLSFAVNDYNIATSGTGSRTLNGTVAAGVNRISFAPIANVSLIIPGVISGTGAVASTIFTKNGAGNLLLTSAGNGFTGKMLVNDGFVGSSGESRFGANPGGFTADQITLNGGGVLSYNGGINFSSNRGITLAANGGEFDASGGTITLTNVVTGPGSLTLKAGTVLLMGQHTYTGATITNSGILQLGINNAISNSSNLVLGGGTFQTGPAAATGFSDVLGTIELAANTIFTLRNNVHSIRFSNSSAITWTGNTLSITGWTGTAGNSGTAGKIYVGTDATGLTSGQLAKINFTGFTAGATLLADGELVPAVPSGTITLSPATQAEGSFCNAAANSISLTYTSTGTITAPFIELSSAAGSFAGATTNLGGTITGSGTFTITGTLPAGIAAGTGYRVRIKSTNTTPILSADNLSNIIVTAAVTPTVSITANPTGTVCSGNSITFTATPANLGGGTVAATGYQWKIGGVDVAGQNTSTYTTTTLANGNIVSCEITITGGCVSSASAVSNNITVTITAPVTPTVSILQTTGTNPSCAGASVTFTAIPATLGGGAVAANGYLWKIGGVNVAGQTAATFTSSTLADGNDISCTITVTGGCVTASNALSSSITINISALPQAPTGAITASDNPSCGPASLTYNNSTPEAGVTYYWQTTAAGTSTAINAGTTNYTVSVTTANIYVRGRNATGCWGPAISSGTITINTAVNITTSPVSQSITTGGNLTFTAAATGTAPLVYQWQESPDGTTWSNVGTNSASFTLTAVPLSKNGFQYRVLISNFCGVKTSSVAILTVTNGPCFEMNGADFPVTTGTVLISGTAMKLASTNNPGSIATTALNTISGNITLKFQGAGWSATEGTVTVTIGAATQTISMFHTDFQEKTMSFSGVVAGSVLKFAAATNNRCFIGNVKIFCEPDCTPAAITLQPATGPVGTIVKITGSSFTAATSVVFNGTPATVSFVSATQLNVVVPAGATTGDVTVNTSLDCDSEAPFTLISSANNGCDLTSGGGTATELILYEIMDEQSGSGGKIVLFNGTSSAVSLSGYSIYRADNYGGTYNNYGALSGSIAAGAIGVVSVSGSSCSLPPTNGTLGSGYNANDGIQLRKSSGTVVVDDVDVEQTTDGYYLKRVFGQYQPRQIYNASDWTVTNIGDGFDCSVMATTPQVAGSAPSISVQPANVALTCNSTTASYTVTGVQGVSGGKNLVFQWFELAPGAANWVAITAGVVSTAANSTLTITPTVKDGYQYYVQVREDDALCFTASSAVNVQVVSETRIIYRSRVTNGAWTSAGSWEMSNDGTTWVNACTWPLEGNSQEVIINTGSKITISGDISIDIDKVTIATGGTLELGTVDALNIRNGNTAGSDLIVNGTFIDRSNSGTGNGVTFAASATWELGTAGTFVKTNNGAVALYRSNYNAGISTIPATASWIYRYTGDGTTVPVIAVDMFYPNLIFESTNGAHNANALSEKFTGASGYTTVKGSLDIGGTGTGTMQVYNENTNALPMQVLGGLTIRTGNALNNYGTTSGTGFEVKNNISIDGALNVMGLNKGLLKLSGTADQTISGSGTDNVNLWDLRVANPAKTIIQDKGMNIFGRLYLENNAGLRFGTGDITLKSTATNTANVAPIANTVIDYAGSGRFIVERYIATNTHGRAWQFLATPTAGAQTIREAWMENNGPLANGKPGFGTLIYSTYGTAGGFDNSGASANMKRYIPATDQWDNGPVATSATITDPKAYMLFVRGDRTSTQTNNNPSVATVLRTRGMLYAPGNLPNNVTTEAGKYQSVGNPYAAAIDIRALLKTNLTSEIYIWDPTLGGTFGFGKYRTLTEVGSNYEITPTGGSYPDDIVNRLQSGQAFFVKAQPGLVGTVGFSEAAKTDSSRRVSRGGEQEVELLKINLSEKSTAGASVLLDGAMAIFGDYSRDRDAEDGQKIPGTNENTSFRAGNGLLAVERRPSPVANDTLYLELSGTRQVNYEWEVNTRHMDKPERSGWLYDQYLQTTTPLNLNGQTMISFTVDTNPLSSADDRFRIVFNKVTGPLPVNFISITATRNADRSIKVQWRTENELNIHTYTVERSANGVNFSGILSENAANMGTYVKNDLSPLAADNYYRIKATGINGEISYSAIVKVSPLPVVSSISVYPNPVEGKTAQLIFTNQPEGNYKVQISNKLGQILYSSNIKVTGANFLKAILLGEMVTAGTYQLKVVNDAGRIFTQQVVIN